MDESDQLHTQAALPQGESARYVWDRKLGGPQIRSGRDGKEKYPIINLAGN